MNERELNELDRVKQTGGDYEISTYIDSCIEKRIKSGKLIEWDSIPFYVPNKVVKVIKKAVLSKDKRYANVSEFLAELTKVRAGLPNWIASKEGFELHDWKGNDYLLTESSEKVILKKRKHKMKTFRVDNSIQAEEFSIAYNQLKDKIKLP